MSENRAPSRDKPNDTDSHESGSLTGDSYEAQDVFEGAEPWSPIETKIVVWSFVSAFVLLAIFSYLINKFILD
jgi:hypothetical protein